MSHPETATSTGLGACVNEIREPKEGRNPPPSVQVRGGLSESLADTDPPPELLFVFLRQFLVRVSEKS